MLKFGVFADLQYADRDKAGKRDYRASLAKFIKMAGSFVENKVPFVLQLGDSVNDGYENLTKVAELFRSSGLKIKNVLGNHDFLVETEKKKEIFRLLNIPKKGYYSFVQNDPSNPNNTWRFVILHGMEISIPAAQTDEELQRAQTVREKYRLPNGKLPVDWNGAISEKQLNWLDSELALADKRGDKVIVCSHFPLYAQAKSVKSIPEVGIIGNLGICFFHLNVTTWNGADVLKIIDRHESVKAYFAGHLHDGAFGTRKKIHYVTFRGLVEASAAHAVVTLDEMKIKIDGFGEEPDRILKF